MAQISGNEQFFTLLRALIDVWCERRCLRPLATVLGPYISFNGLTDGWAEINTALKTVRALDRDLLLESELRVIDNLVRAADHAIYDRS
jgi:hypothetical protein